jgi:hypothetical protein
MKLRKYYQPLGIMPKVGPSIFEKLVLMHLKAHIILEGLVEHGYVGIDERSKVRHLMESIKTKSLDAVKAQIMANAELRTDFNACVTLFKDFISQERSANGAERQISSATSTGGGGGDTDYNRYVPDPKWQGLAQDERDKYTAARKAAREAKKKAGGGGGGGGGKGKATPKKNPKQAKWMKKEIKRQVAKALTVKDDDDDDEVPMKDDEGGGHSMRQKSSKKKSA